MSSPTEQLIRDYLKRLSAAARGQLGPGDRDALVDRTREFIERKTGSGGRPTPLEVGRLLSGLGDPAGLVSQERQRLATLHGEPPEPVSRGLLARVRRGEPGKVRGASWHWPVQPGSRADLQFTLIDGRAAAAGRQATAQGREAARPVGAEVPGSLVPKAAPLGDRAPARPVWPTLAAGTADDTIERQTSERDTVQYEVVDGEIVDGEIVDGEIVDGEVVDGEVVDGEVVDGEVVDGDEGERGTREPDAGQQELDHQPPDHQRWRPNPAATASGARPAGLAGMNWVTAAPRRPSRFLQLLGSLGGWSRRHKLETVALALLGLGGVIFPPVWLLGAAVALASRLWDYRDKWVGLALPVLLTVIGTAAGISLGGRVSFGYSLHEGWAFAVDVSRATAVLSAGYLGWRAARGPRPPAAPPWDKPHRVN